ncbi:MAG TPA: protein-L-isoaspartate(D-aspartate) O-methyltransferase [Bacillota bacterium]|nr:protein-L-isoaspartate(D-aspartate) O-methyltransferase [Bacillota bacterium]
MSQTPTNYSDLNFFFQNLDRSFFLDGEYQRLAGYDRPLPIGYEQTISQPTLVLQMTAYLNLTKNLKVLEIGTGSGYQTAFLAEFAGEVYTVERIAPLAEKARERLEKLGYRNIFFKVDNGSVGWEEFASYDRIIVTAAAGKLPEPLLVQLNPGGLLLIPVGERGCQDLLLLKKDESGLVIEESLGKVTFVELKGDYGWEKTGN